MVLVADWATSNSEAFFQQSMNITFMRVKDRDGKIDIRIAGLLESNSSSVLFLGCLSIQNAMCSYPSMSVIYSDISDTPMFDG